MLMLLIASLAAGPITTPPEIIGYFERQDAAHQKKIAALETTIQDMEVAIKSEPLAKRKAALTGTMHKQQDALAKLKKSKERDVLKLPVAAEVRTNDVGLLPPMKVHAVLDDNTAILSDGVGTSIILKTDTKDIKARSVFTSKDPWHVTSIKKVDEAIQRYVPTSAFIYTVTPVDMKQLPKQRAEFDKKP